MKGTAYPNLFSEFTVGSFSARNRVVMAPMATNFATPDGGTSERLIQYYEARARGGTGTIIVENTNVDYPQGANGAVQLRLDEDRFIPGLSTLVERLHMYGARVVLQINHAGASTRKELACGLQPVAPSPIPASRGGEVPREITGAEMDAIVERFAQAAYRAKRAGFDSVEIHGGHSYLLAQFMSPLTNTRTDQYGGSLENRMRFPLAVVRAVRRAVGDGYTLFLRFSADEFVEGGRTAEEAVPIAIMFRDAGVDILHVSAGNGYSLPKQIEPMPYEEGWRVYLAAEIRKATGMPVITVGTIRNPEFADLVIREGSADLVAMGRGLIADPEWCNKAASGRQSDICPCISCNVGCAGSRIFGDVPLKCAVNPLAGREWLFRDAAGGAAGASVSAKRVVVVGGGPAGLTAAIYARKAGHDVTLLEQAESTGGQLNLAAVPPGKSKIGWFTAYLNRSAEKAGVAIRCGARVTANTLVDLGADAVVVATGSRPACPPVPGLASALSRSVVTAHEVLAGKVDVSGRRVVVCGGGLVGCETALYLAGMRNVVSVVEMLPEIGREVDPIYKEELLNKLEDLGVTFFPSRKIVTVQDGHLRVEPCDRQAAPEEIPFDLAVLALGAVPAHELYYEIQGLFPVVVRAGDCDRPGKIIDAVWQGFVAARSVTEAFLSQKS
ncbi:MAG: FAD-dependent oxidoreductase [Firmicutes bacterium]|nr:FAD-dependent oxidoreductase [Bacillota bacterium]